MPRRFNHALLCQRRLDLGYTQEDVAERLGISLTTYRRYETGRVNKAGGFSIRHVRRQNILHLMVQLLELPDIETLLDDAPEASPPPQLATPQILPRIDISHLPPSDGPLVGRDAVITALNEALASPSCHIASLIGWGGIGKTSVINRWLALGSAAGFSGVAGVFAWSFHGQGADGGKSVSSDLLLHDLQRWLQLDTSDGSGARERARKIAASLQRNRVLLILDGLEVAQEKTGAQTGRINDPGLRILLSLLAAQNAGLCVIASRLKVTTLDSFVGITTRTIPLTPLEPEVAGGLLAELGLRGSRAELQAAATELKGHPLSLRLLARFLQDARGTRNVSQRHPFPHASSGDEELAPAAALMESYEGWYERDHPAELQLLGLLGLFQGPASPLALSALMAAPTIEGVTDALAAHPSALNRAIARLRAAGLILPGGESGGQGDDDLDCHPLLRQHFGQRLREQHPHAWREAHGRLFEHYCSYSSPLPETLDEMAPLFLAMRHGLWAERFVETFAVAWERISRGEELFVVTRLGALGACLEALSYAFDEPWTRPLPGMPEVARTRILDWVGRVLMGMGRIREAIPPLELAFNTYASTPENRTATSTVQVAWFLVHALTEAGELARAEAILDRAASICALGGDGPGDQAQAEVCVELARSFIKHQRGDVAAAASHAATAMAIAPLADAASSGPQWRNDPHLYVLLHYHAQELRVELGHGEDVARYVDAMLRDAPVHPVQRLADVALLARVDAELAAARRGDKAALDNAAQTLEGPEGVLAQLRRHELLNYLLCALVTAGELKLLQGGEAVRLELPAIHAELEELIEGGAEIFQVDLDVQRAQAALARGAMHEAASSVRRAARLARRFSYGRHTQRLGQLRRQLQI